jgi:hypothetical protein
MKKTNWLIVLSLPVLLSLSGCVIKVGSGDGESQYFSSDHHDIEAQNRKKIARLELRQAYDEVKTIFGTANFNESYQKDGQQIQVLYYRTHRVHADGMTTKDECTPLVFKEGYLVSWGEQALNQI